MTTMVLHDTRLEGRTPQNYDLALAVDGDDAIRDVIARVREIAGHQQLESLHVMCHGIEMGVDLRRNVSFGGIHGGFGLALGREGLDLRNVALTQAWRGLAKQIALFACAIADVGPNNAGTRGDGPRFCGELALWTQAEVVAGSAVQRYARGAEDFWTRANIARTTPIDFGPWEGQVFRFSPSSPHGQPYRPRPYDPRRPAGAV